MAKKHEDTGISLEALQGRGDKLADWIGSNPTLILGTFGSVLLISVVVGVVGASQDEAAEEAATRLAVIQAEYRAAMGGTPDSYVVPEPANPETARAVRTEYAAAFGQMIEDHAGQPAAALAALDMGEIELALGDGDAALATWRQAADEAEGVLRSVLLVRVAGQLEDSGQPAEAAAAYEQAGAVASYALRHRALADAARCRADAGENDQAVALLQRLEAEAPGYAVPDHIAARLMEIRAASIDN